MKLKGVGENLRGEASTLQLEKEAKKKRAVGGAVCLRSLLEDAPCAASNLRVVDLFKSMDQYLREEEPDDVDFQAIQAMLDLWRQGRFRVKSLKQRTDDGLSHPCSSLFDCIEFSHSLSQEDWEQAIQEVREGFRTNLTPMKAPGEAEGSESEPGGGKSDEMVPEREPDLSREDAHMLAEGVVNLVKLVVQRILAPHQPGCKANKELVWMAQTILKSPDDRSACDGPPWHIDEFFYYLHSVCTFLGDSTMIVDVN